MINFKIEEELFEILKKFSVPRLFYQERRDAGPDEELYFFDDKLLLIDFINSFYIVHKNILL